MADNVAITAGSGTTIAADDVGSGVLHQRVKVTWGADGTGNDTNATTPLPVNTYATVRRIVSSTMTRPANTTAYAAGDLIANNATAGSVTAVTFTLADANDQPFEIRRMLVDTTDTGLKGKTVTALLWRSDPTASSGVVNGDNGAFSIKHGATFCAAMQGTFRSDFSDGAWGEFVPIYGGSILGAPGSGAQTLWLLYKSEEAFTPSANSTTLIATIEALQLR